MEVADRLEWKQIYWINGPDKRGRAPRGDLWFPSKLRWAVNDTPTCGWGLAFIIVGEKHHTIFCPYSMTSYSVPSGCAELVSAKEPKEFRKDFMVSLIHKNWAQSQQLGLGGDLDTAAVVLKMLGAEVPHRIMTALGEDTRSRGGKQVEEKMKKPVKRKGKRGDFLAWFMEANNSRPVREAMAHFGMTRSNVLSYLFILQKDHGIGYSLQGDLATIELPAGVADPFEEAK